MPERSLALIYARVSTEDQAEKYGLAAQLRACREFVAANGLEVVEEISDDVTGATLDRPGLKRLRQIVSEGGVSVVVMLDPDRLSRDLSDLLKLKREIESRARLAFVTAAFEQTSSGRLFFSLKGAIAEYEREVIGERTMRGRQERAREGRRVGGRAPFGYRDDDGRLVVVEERAAVARQIFKWYDSGLSLCEITRRLRASGVQTRSGKPWWYTAVRAILSNEVYAGVGHWGAERIPIPAPALVARDLWERVQARLANNPAPNVGRPSTAYLLRGLLYCGCGRRMHGQKVKRGRFFWYRCEARHRTFPERPYCGAQVRAEKLDATAWRVIVETFTDRDRLAAIIRENEAQARPTDADRLPQLEAQAKSLRRREERARELMADPDLAEDRLVFKRQYLEAQRERRAVESEIFAARRATPAAEGAWIDEAVSLIREELMSINTAAERQEVIRGILGRALLNGDELEMRCFIVPKSSSSSGTTGEFPSLQITVKAMVAA